MELKRLVTWQWTHAWDAAAATSLIPAYFASLPMAPGARQTATALWSYTAVVVMSVLIQASVSMAWAVAPLSEPIRALASNVALLALDLARCTLDLSIILISAQPLCSSRDSPNHLPSELTLIPPITACLITIPSFLTRRGLPPPRYYTILSFAATLTTATTLLVMAYTSIRPNGLYPLEWGTTTAVVALMTAVVSPSSAPPLVNDGSHRPPAFKPLELAVARAIGIASSIHVFAAVSTGTQLNPLDAGDQAPPQPGFISRPTMRDFYTLRAIFNSDSLQDFLGSQNGQARSIMESAHDSHFWVFWAALLLRSFLLMSACTRFMHFQYRLGMLVPHAPRPGQGGHSYHAELREMHVISALAAVFLAAFSVTNHRDTGTPHGYTPESHVTRHALGIAWAQLMILGVAAGISVIGAITFALATFFHTSGMYKRAWGLLARWSAPLGDPVPHLRLALAKRSNRRGQ